MSAEEVIALLRERKAFLAVAESCTGGLLAASITSVPGSSEVFDRGFVTYSNQAKAECLGVPPAVIEKNGAVSEEVARAMAQGALAHSSAHLAISITGIAGPGGGTAQKPVGLVHFALGDRSGTVIIHKELFGALSRDEIRRGAVELALQLLEKRLRNPAPLSPSL